MVISVLPWDHVVEQAPAETPLGMLQRGSGEGALWAATASPKEAHPLILQAMSWDPRWDRIMEKRALFFGRLAVDLGLDLEPLFEHIRANDSGSDAGERVGRKTGIICISPVIELAMAIVALLMVRRNPQACEFARRYAAGGNFWRELLEYAGQMGGSTAVDGMDDVLAARFTAGERETAFEACDPRREPWKTWAVLGASELTPSLQAKAREQEESLREYREKRDEKLEIWKSKSTDELLTLVNGECHDELAKRNSEADVAVMLAAIRPENGKKAAAAIRALGDQLNPRMIDPTARTLEANPAENLIYIQAAPFLSRFPAELVLPLARKWLASGADSVWHCTRAILFEHATTEDAPFIVPILKKKVTPRSMTQVCDALRISARFKGYGPMEDVRRLYREVPSSWARSWAAAALAATEPDFAEKYAYGCLWDCESATRETGIAHVPLKENAARQRLQALASDPLESEETRAAASARVESV